MTYVADYYTPPDCHPNNAEIVSLEIEQQKLQKEYNALTADDVEWTQAGELRCVEIELRLYEIEREINYLTNGDSL